MFRSDNPVIPDDSQPSAAGATRRSHSAYSADVQRFTIFLLLLTLLAVTYGSLYPLQFEQPASLAAAADRMQFQFSAWRRTGDVVANIVLFVPIGALSWLIVERWPLSLARRALAVVAAGFLFGFALQVLQLWVPQRFPQVSDAVWNTLGQLVGIGVAGLLRAPLERVARIGRSSYRAACALGTLWLALAWWPLLPTLNRRQLWAAWHQLGRALDAAPLELLLPAFGLAAVLHLLRRAPWRGAVMLAAPALALTGTFLFSKQPDGAVQPLGWLLGGLLGALSWRLPARAADGLVVGGAILMLLAQSLLPWGWSQTAASWSWVPLEHTLSEERVVRSFVLGWQLFACAAAIVSGHRLGLPPARVAAALTTLLLALESVQRWMPPQQAEITPVLLPLLCLALLRSVVAGAGRRACGT